MVDYINEYAKMNETKETFFNNMVVRHGELTDAITSLNDTVNCGDALRSKIEQDLLEIDGMLAELLT